MKGILVEINWLCSEKKVEKWEAGSGAVELSIWAMCVGEQAQKKTA